MNTAWIILCLPLLIQCHGFNQGNTRLSTRCILGDWTPWGFCVLSNDGRCQRVRSRIVQGLGCGSPIDTSSCERSQCTPHTQPTPPSIPPPPTPATCTEYRVRKNVNALTSQEISRLQTLMMTVVNNRSYQDVAHFHGEPNTGVDALCRDENGGDGYSCCPHGNSQFLPWHRLLMSNMEELLGEPLPYWDWTEDEDVPQIFETISVPLKNSQSVASDISCLGTDRSRHRRGRNINIDSMALKWNKTGPVGVYYAFQSMSYDEFSGKIQSSHNYLHNWMNCDMRFENHAAYDPVFYLHHANVDRQFAFWQELQRIRKRNGIINTTIDENNLRSNLRPFHEENKNPYEKTRKNSVGENTLDYKTNLCYEYDTLTFDGMTPEQFINGDSTFIALGYIAPVSSFATVGVGRYFVGVVLPMKGPSSIVEFEVCSNGGRCQRGGSVATFGSRSPTPRKGVSSTHYYISEVEVTDLNVGNWFESFGRVTTSPNVSPVSPIIIWRPQGTSLDGGQVILAPGTNRGMYGDLLDNFSDPLVPVAAPAE